ncbi:MAG: PQQ-binding-like beta-propeller repeat protein [Acidobacteria bacterium]|nr:PQQ-binding-like beta-propeller repeat protein [Acidobacteriota bacterium]NIM60761.1 PQQ-binding-like beta-propeller repeat protein [Acidobacteriota bacterium]NIO57974.1 PQQ-binding-like beta-propeller repeat protein [Acidobacteriota bacterium]NIQ28979.1 PQQ-binding-like beta-propeller repeat protein [Acidobacteriota bacterium]NIQ83451.1 PQQ-binding-like beta-propeller repeat protein [Acidobacteriota bacterium]
MSIRNEDSRGQRALTLIVAIASAVLLAPAGEAGDWTSWRGPSYTGVSEETGLIDRWSPEGENLVWKADFIGRSTPVVIDGRVCVIGRTGVDPETKINRQEIVACYDAGDGKKLWEHKYNVYMTTVPFNRVGWASLVADPETGNVYAHGVAGQFTAYAPDGTIVWSRFLTEEFGRLSGYGGRTQTALIDGDQAIINFVSVGWGELMPLRHRFFSFDKKTGDLLWVSTPGQMAADFNTQGGPVVATVNGRRLLISGNADGWIYALDIATGEKIWGFHLSKRGINVTVVFENDTVFVSHSEENVDTGVMGRMVAIDATGSGDVTKTHEKWRIEEFGGGFPSPAVKDGVVYHVDNSANLHAIDAASGEIKWVYNIGTVGKASPVIADGKIYVPETNGRFHILKLKEDGVEPLDHDELTIANGDYAEFYGSVATAYGRIYFATEGGVYCLGDKSKPFKVERSEPAKKAGKPGPATTLQVVPWEVQLELGQSADFRVRLLDADGNVLSEKPATWSLDGLAGSVEDGAFKSGGEGFQAGKIVAKVGGLTGYARARVYPPLPWSFDFEEFDTGGFPKQWIGANRIYLAGEKDGAKVLVKAPRGRGLNRTFLYMGPSWLNNYTIEADIFGEGTKRRRPDIGLINSGYILDLAGAKNHLEVRSWTAELRMAKQVPFEFEPNTWYRMKLKVVSNADKATVYGKVWKKSDPEPEDWTITADDPHPIPGGTPGLLGYSPVNLYYDNVTVYPN